MTTSIVFVHDTMLRKWWHAHRQCCTKPQYRIIRELSPTLDFGNRICEKVLKPKVTPYRPAADPRAPTMNRYPQRLTDSGGVVLLRKKETGHLYHACTQCAEAQVKTGFDQVRTFRNCGSITCSFCGERFQSAA